MLRSIVVAFINIDVQRYTKVGWGQDSLENSTFVGLNGAHHFKNEDALGQKIQNESQDYISKKKHLQMKISQFKAISVGSNIICI